LEVIHKPGCLGLYSLKPHPAKKIWILFKLSLCFRAFSRETGGTEMQIATMAIVMAAAGTPAMTAVPAVEYAADICIHTGASDWRILEPAKAIASKMFASIGVTTRWHGGWHMCPAGALQVWLDGDTPVKFFPGALAYARPYEGTQIHVFLDRVINEPNSEFRPILLAHVLAHEITHILEGVSSHSDTGLMKAHWGNRDFSEMAWRPLPFAAQDVELIHAGLAKRRAILAAKARPMQ
jgi:hypothetical protein